MAYTRKQKVEIIRVIRERAAIIREYNGRFLTLADVAQVIADLPEKQSWWKWYWKGE